jgi:ATP-dependent protease ClpP protease subunit
MRNVKGLFPVFLVLVLLLSVFVAPLELCSKEDGEFKETPYPVVERVENGRCSIQDGVGYFFLITTVSGEAETFARACLIFDRYKVKKIVVILNSPGGSLFDGLAVAQMIEEQKGKGKIIEMRCHGVAASAASLILASGSVGYRFMSPNAMLMIHELSVFKYLAVESVSDQEKGARISRQIQQNVMSFLARNTKLSIEELTEKSKDEAWAIAKTAIEWGFADKVIQ